MAKENPLWTEVFFIGNIIYTYLYMGTEKSLRNLFWSISWGGCSTYKNENRCLQPKWKIGPKIVGIFTWKMWETMSTTNWNGKPKKSEHSLTELRTFAHRHGNSSPNYPQIKGGPFPNWESKQSMPGIFYRCRPLNRPTVDEDIDHAAADASSLFPTGWWVLANGMVYSWVSWC